MFLFLVVSSFLLGCLSVILLLILVYIQIGLSTRIPDIEYPSYEKFHPLSQYDVGKNATVDAINNLINFLFQEIRDTSEVRQYLTQKINIELEELQETRFGKLFLREIYIHNFSTGRQSPILNDIRLYQIDEKRSENRPLLEKVVALVNGEYNDGFSLVINIKLPFDFQCQVYVHLKHIQADLRLEFRREPFSHWLLALQKEPTLNIDMKVYLSNRQCFLVPRFILEQIRRSLRRKQIWPKYKIRYKPFFPRSIDFLPEEPLLTIDRDGTLEIAVLNCDRLDIPKYLLSSEENFPLFVYITLETNSEKAEDYLRLRRDQWPTIECFLDLRQHQLHLKRVMYNDHQEILIDRIDPFPEQIDDAERIRTALIEKNLFLLKIDDQQIDQLDRANHLLKSASAETQILLAIPVLNSVRVPLPATNQETTLMMMNSELIDALQWGSTDSQLAEPYVEFKKKFKFQFDNDDDEYLNVYLWCKVPPDFGLPIMENRSILLGYTTGSLAEIFFQTHMSFGRETQLRLNFHSATSWKLSPQRDFLKELRTHRGFDENLAHGFITLNIKHDVDVRSRTEDEFLDIVNESRTTTTMFEENETTMRNRFDFNRSKHQFVDQTLSFGTTCDHCLKKIWSTSVRQCRRCLKISHSKCENDFRLICAPTSRLSLPDLLKPKTQKMTSSRLSIDSKISAAASSAYQKLLDLKTKRTTTMEKKKLSVDSETLLHENIPEEDLRDILTICRIDEANEERNLRDFLHEKAVDHTVLYERANRLAPSLFNEYPLIERKQKLDNEIARLEQDIRLQGEIRDELIVEFNGVKTNEQDKKRIQMKIENVDEKIQALGAMTIMYCAGVQYCCQEIDKQNFANQ